MLRRRREQHPWTNQPGRLVIHENPYDILAKLNWEANEFELKRSDPEKPIDVDGMVYLLQNACISTASLVEWLEKAAHDEARSRGRQIDKALFEKRFWPGYRTSRWRGLSPIRSSMRPTETRDGVTPKSGWKFYSRPSSSNG